MMSKQFCYNHKNILITGASSGLGKYLALKYCQNGGRIINISRNQQKMTVLNNKLQQINNNDHLYYSADVSKYDDIIQIKDDLKKKKYHSRYYY